MNNFLYALYVFDFIMSIILIIMTIVVIKSNILLRKNMNHRRASIYENYKVITLCGSTKFKKEFEEIQKELTLRGHIVISLGCFAHIDDKLYDIEKLKDMHRARIDLASLIVVVNKDGYIGNHTRMEIKYAKRTHKPVYYYYEN